MKLLIAVIQNGFATMYAGPKTKGKQAELDEEAQFLELKLLTNNPRNKENLEFWKDLVKKKSYYGLLVVVDHDENSMTYLPLQAKKDWDAFIEESACMRKE